MRNDDRLGLALDKVGLQPREDRDGGLHHQRVGVEIPDQRAPRRTLAQQRLHADQLLPRVAHGDPALCARRRRRAAGGAISTRHVEGRRPLAVLERVARGVRPPRAAHAARVVLRQTDRERHQGHRRRAPLGRRAVRPAARRVGGLRDTVVQRRGVGRRVRAAPRRRRRAEELAVHAPRGGLRCPDRQFRTERRGKHAEASDGHEHAERAADPSSARRTATRRRGKPQHSRRAAPHGGRQILVARHAQPV